MRKPNYVLALNTAGIDAVVNGLTKATPIEHATINEKEIPRSRHVFYGDGGLDLPGLQVAGLFAVGAPANARDEVKECVNNSSNGYLSHLEILDGFFDFYKHVCRHAEESGIDPADILLDTDKDGSILQKRVYTRGQEFARLIERTGIDSPLVRVLTGSSVLQNRDSGFMKFYGLTKENLGNNPAVQKHPYLMLCENGCVLVNVLDHQDIKLIVDEEYKSLIERLVGPIRERAIQIMRDGIMQSLGLHWITDNTINGYLSQKDDPKGIWQGKDKLSMITFNVPQGLRQLPIGRLYRDAVADCFARAIEEEGLSYKMIG